MSSEFYLDQFFKGVNSLPNELTGTLKQMTMLDRSIEFEKRQAEGILEVVITIFSEINMFFRNFKTSLRD